MAVANETIALQRFLDAQNQTYLKALSEIRFGRKLTHWMWFVFPQLKGLGHSDTALFYSISDLKEATAFLSHPVLGKHLIEISQAVLNIKEKSANEIFGNPDDLKLRSCMTLFANVLNADVVFQQVLDHYFGGKQDEQTLRLLLKKKLQHDTV
ncbi:hypothetical protein FNO01nite_18270 [Flavobacterium noncentrifugens]|uniref:Uncharacterized protein, DUF1810 family n=1 Tax=Flavobacterium noncentrifugens TaxID=1128970 RepID=A0A1G8YCG6_9FLAO|nr:DUF1810 domain-containing protein [Flavobacterium noncentrifugens]GEP51155.1 hypothetical protein FNO01nite_18270 [Flavobacterium noncentrifugens]SDJ99925.1 Uncharacterized protein, DUF1810 family [Flavobacterium noncentrifugens]